MFKIFKFNKKLLKVIETTEDELNLFALHIVLACSKTLKLWKVLLLKC